MPHPPHHTPWRASGRVTLTGPWLLSVRRVNVDGVPVGLVWRAGDTWRWAPWTPDLRSDLSRPARSRDAAVAAVLRSRAAVLGLDLSRPVVPVRDAQAARPEAGGLPQSSPA